jgi:SnoaL-like protein
VNDSSTVTRTAELVERYFAIWNETDPARRRELITTTWSPDLTYLDPLFSAAGPDALDTLVEGVHEQFPGHRFRLIGQVDLHHDRARWAWELAGPAGGPTVAAGVDFALLTADGRLHQVTGFFEPPAAA